MSCRETGLPISARTLSAVADDCAYLLRGRKRRAVFGDAAAMTGPDAAMVTATAETLLLRSWVEHLEVDAGAMRAGFGQARDVGAATARIDGVLARHPR